ncbi:MAG: exodeoxyribonuclease III [Candidatus Heimdallarchaeota archaeon]|nr:exodeoxyribonuclease III [Candidatus Heimdallarchaeota archaeon]
MKEYSIISWNVNGLRAVSKKKVFQEKNFFEWWKTVNPDIFCLQETKAHPQQVTKKLSKPETYHSFWNSGERKGYSGVLTYSQEEPISIHYDLGVESFDIEGRLIATEFPHFVLFNVYFPNGKKNDERLKYKLDFYDKFLETIDNLRDEGKSIVFCGDVNTAHNPIDLARPKANETISGFLPIERAWMDKVIKHGYVDTFRHFHPDEPDHYTWWTYRSPGARERNVGWRLDYFFVSKDILDAVKEADIFSEVKGSDHCPVGLTLQFKDS